MIRKLTAALIFLMALSFGSAAGAVEYEDANIGNLTFQAPVSAPASRTKEDNVAQIVYTVDDGIILVQYISESSEDKAIQEQKVNELAASFEGLDSYTQVTDLAISFESKPADLRVFSYNNGSVTYSAKSYNLYTGTGIASFTYVRPDNADAASSEEVYSTMIGSAKSSSEEFEFVEDAPPVQKEFAEGIYSGEAAMPEGEYILFPADGKNGHVTISSGNAKDNLKLNRSFNLPIIIRNEANDVVEFHNANAVLAEVGQDMDFTASGMYEAGVHFAEGTYDITAIDGSGYFTVYADSSENSIISEGVVNGTATVSVTDGQCLELDGCIFRTAPAKPEKQYMDVDTVKKVQQYLAQNGYVMAIDGILGDQSKGIIEQFAASKGLSSGSKITPELLDIMGIAHD